MSECPHKHVTVPLTKGYVAVVDEPDLARVLIYNWYVRFGNARPGARRNAYAITHAVYRKTGKQLHMHRLVFGADLPLDHRDGDGLNNCRLNLRLATATQNMANRPKYRAGTSRFKGVRLEDNKWRAAIKVAGRNISLGRFALEEQAALAYDVAATEAFGEFARTNFPPEAPK